MSDKAGGIVLAIDGGGTSSRCLAIDADGVIRGSATGGPSNHILNPWETVCESIEKVICGALEDASIQADAVRCISLGTAGTGPDGLGKEAMEDLVRKILPAKHIVATGDMVIAFHGAVMEDHGVVVNAGTGSVVYGRSATGAYRQVGGWGHVLGDEGSAYDIAVHGLRAAARCMDGRGESTKLVNIIPQALDVSDMIQVAFTVYGLNLSREKIAGLARAVAEAAEGGDVVSCKILHTAAEELALAVTVAIRELGLDTQRIPVSYIGSVFDSGELVIRPFAEAVMMQYPQAAILPPKFPAVIGAFILGAKAIGWSISSNMLMNIKESVLNR